MSASRWHRYFACAPLIGVLCLPFGCVNGETPSNPGDDDSGGAGNASGTGGSAGVAGTGVGGTSVGGAGGFGGAGAVAGAASGAAGVGPAGTGGGAGQGNCQVGLSDCGSGCIDPLTDEQHCGTCGTACGVGQECLAGLCECLAPQAGQPALTRCGAACVDTTSDGQNCGMCGTACPQGQVCSGGTCSASCATGLTPCSGSCANLQNDSANCGMCGMSCAPGTICQGGTCGCPTAGQMLCGTACADTQTSAQHCGGCNMACGTPRTCGGGACACPSGLSYCATSDTCLDTQSDINNCGSCSNRCPIGAPCTNGACGSTSCTPDSTTYNGRITYYELATPLVACHYPTNTLPQYYGAMNEQDYNNAAVCGACVDITNTQNGSRITAWIVDECPIEGNAEWCYNGSHHIDLNPAAYQALGANNNPPITWRYVECPTTGNLRYYIDPASQQFYLAITPMHHRFRIAKMEVMKDGAFVQLTRRDYNAFELTMGAGTGTLTVRVTDIYNRVLQDSVAFSPGQVVNGQAQFPACN